MSDVESILLTGANGFVGGAVQRALEKSGGRVRPAFRSERSRDRIAAGEGGVVAPLTAATDWGPALADIQVVVHCAARVHVMRDGAADPLAEFRAVNVDGTINLARQAAAVGVRRLVFVSSVKVNGESTVLGRPFTADDEPAPEDAYGISKHEAEAGLRELAHATSMEVVILRSPLVYGPGVKGNFASLLRWIERGLPLPLGAVTGNRRSLVALDNLADLIALCTRHPVAANQTFMASDDEDLSTAELLRRLGRTVNRPARLLRVPVSLMNAAARILGKQDVAQRLLGSLQVDIGKTRELLDWAPPLSVDEGLRRLVRRGN